MSLETADVVVIGAGIAGASAAANLAGDRRVVVLERESFPGMHSTGRSAALFSEIYGSAPVRALSRASRDFLYTPPAGFSEKPLVRNRGALHVATAAQLPALEAFANLPDVMPAVQRLSGESARALCPILRADYIAAGVLETGSADLDVDALHQGWLRELRARGGRLLVDADVTALLRQGGGWRVETPAGAFEAPVVVDAAGAWADVVAALAGAAPIGLQPCRRTGVIVEAPEGADSDAWPMVIDVDEEWYFRPDAGALMLSPADETPCEPCDAQPEELDIAIAVDRVMTATTLDVRRVRRSWAGLRSFVADRTPVVGFAPDAPGFFWLAGQGGYGIQTAPAMGVLAAALVRGDGVPAALAAHGVAAEDLAPARLGAFPAGKSQSR
jgi:D-arginine dehydrogenase